MHSSAAFLNRHPKRKNLIVYGTGFLNSTDRGSSTNRKRFAPFAARSPRSVSWNVLVTARKYTAILQYFSKKFYLLDINQKYTLGIIQHWSDYQKISHHYAYVPGVQVITVESGATNFLDEICSCRYIASSSFHGLIMVDAYNIPTVWIKMLSGMHLDDFKFYDYYGSVRCEREPVNPLSYTVKDICTATEHVIHPIHQEKLLAACPFSTSHKTTGLFMK